MTGSTVPKEWIAWGGTLGTRYLNRLLTFKPILISVPAGQVLPPFSFSGTVGSSSASYHLRLILYDLAEERTSPQGVDVNNLIQFIPLAFPANNGGYPLPSTNPRPFRKYSGDAGSVAERLQESRANGVLYGAKGLVHPGDIVQSLVPNHGDFRLLAAKRAVMQGRGSGVEDTSAREYPTFVAHPNYGLKGFPLAHSLTEPKPEMNLTLDRKPVFGVKNDFGYFTRDQNSVDLRLAPEYMPDFPIKPWEDRTVRLVGNLSLSSLSQGALRWPCSTRPPEPIWWGPAG